MLAQREVSRTRLERRMSSKIQVLVDGIPDKGRGTPRGVRAVGRSRLEAPEVDGVVFLRQGRAQSLEPGAVLTVKVVKTLEYDLLAEPAGACD